MTHRMVPARHDNCPRLSLPWPRAEVPNLSADWETTGTTPIPISRAPEPARRWLEDPPGCPGVQELGLRGFPRPQRLGISRASRLLGRPFRQPEIDPSFPGPFLSLF